MPAHSADAAAGGSSDATRTSDGGRGPEIGRRKRVGAAVLGGALLVFGLRRRSLAGTAIALVGGWLSYRAISGRGRPSRESGVNTAGGRERSGSGTPADPPTVERSITIGRPAGELSELLRDPENLGPIVGHFAEVTAAGEDRHRWVVRGPLDRDLSWETRIVEEQSGDLLRWEPVDGGALFDEWSVSFRPAPGERGTEVTLRVRFDPPGGALGSAGMERLDVVPRTLVGTALDRLKSLAETGEVPTLDRNPSARGKGDLL